MLMPRCQCRDFQIAFKISCLNHLNNVAQKLKEMADVQQNKIELEKHLNKQTTQSLQGLRNIY